MNKSVLTIAAIAALAMPEYGMATAMQRPTGVEPTEAEMRSAVVAMTEAPKQHFQHLELHCQTMRGGSSIEALRCLYGTFGAQASSNMKVTGFKKVRCVPAPPGWACQYVIHMDMGELDVFEMSRPTVQVKLFVKTYDGWVASGG